MPVTGPGSGKRPDGRPGGPARRSPTRKTAARATSATRSASSSARPAPAPPRGATTGLAPFLPAWLTRGTTRTKRLVVLGAVVVMLVVVLAPTVRRYIGQRSQIASLGAQVAAQGAQVADPQRQQLRWQDPAYVAEQARERLKFVKVGETAYTVIDGSAAAPATDPHLAVAPGGAEHPWYGRLWASMVAADTPSATP